MPAWVPPPGELAAALAAAAPRLGPYGRLHYAPEIGSTNDAALALAAAGAPEGTSVLADVQTAGRGRRGRLWHSPPEAGLYLSIVVRTTGWRSPVSLATLAAGVAAADAVQAASGLSAELKWPNDLVVGRPWRKLGGILCEAAGPGGHVEALAVGIGVNLRAAAYPPEVAARATSLESELGRGVDRSSLALEVLAALREVIDALRAGEGARVCERWRVRARAGFNGARVRWQDAGGERRGAAVDIDEDGALVVLCDGRRERLIAGEVTWERI